MAPRRRRRSRPAEPRRRRGARWVRLRRRARRAFRPSPAARVQASADSDCAQVLLPFRAKGPGRGGPGSPGRRPRGTSESLPRPRPTTGGGTGGAAEAAEVRRERVEGRTRIGPAEGRPIGRDLGISRRTGNGTGTGTRRLGPDPGIGTRTRIGIRTGRRGPDLGIGTEVGTATKAARMSKTGSAAATTGASGIEAAATSTTKGRPGRRSLQAEAGRRNKRAGRGADPARGSAPR